ncbi:MAG: HAD-IIA family hydrolase [Anaerolineales bacterium]
MAESEVGAILLAAGGSTRFGRPKQLLEWEGRPLVAHVADIIWMAGLSPIVVVGAEADAVIEALEGRPVQILRNYRWQEGMSTSVHVGLAALPPTTQGALFLQVDQPYVTPNLLQALIQRWRESSPALVVPAWKGRRGSPVLFDRALFPQLAGVTGDAGGRTIIDEHLEDGALFEVSDPLLLSDMDRPEDYERLRAAVGEQQPASLLSPLRTVVCDMDGVLWRGDRALPGLHAFFDLLREHELDYMLVTNNASRTPEQYVEKLAGLDVEVTAEHILTSALAAADYVAARAEPEALVYPIGGSGVEEALRSRGLRLSEGDRADYVVVGWDRRLTWDKMATATLLIRGGAHFVGTNPDRTFPSEAGLVPGAGAQLALLRAATDVEPTVMGKPEPVLYRQALERLGARAEESLMIGDRLDTDILGGIRMGMPTALVLSGVHAANSIRSSPIHPDLVFEDLARLVEAWREALT